MSKISRRLFIQSAATSVVGSGVLAGAMVAATTVPSGPVAEKREIYEDSDFIDWRFGEKSRSTTMIAKSADFHYWYKPVLEKKSYNFRKEVVRACESIDRKRKGKTIALCLSGGADSEVIALTLMELGIPFELYFLDNWGLNRDTYLKWVAPFAKKINKEVIVMGLGREYFISDHAKKSFMEIGCEFPTYLAMTYLFERIPQDRFIITGDGDLDRTGELFKYIGGANRHPTNVPGMYIPFATSSVAYRIWAKKHNRPGEYYFFSSTPQLIGSVLMDSRFKINFPFSNTKDVIWESFPELERRPKTTNWDTEFAASENDAIRRALRYKVKGLNYWKPAMGTIARVDDIFLS